jgi:hypothetical protein
VIEGEFHHIAGKAVVSSEYGEGAAPAMRRMLAVQAQCYAVYLLDGFAADVLAAGRGDEQV